MRERDGGPPSRRRRPGAQALLWRRAVVVAFGLVLVLVALLLQRGHLPAPAVAVHDRLELLSYDLRLATDVVLDPEPYPGIVIVDIDERSLQRVGRWPWPRRTVARLTERLYEAGAVVIAYDMVFAEPEPNPAHVVKERLGDITDLPPELARRLEEAAAELDGDRRLAEALARGEVVLGFLFDRGGRDAVGALPEPLPVDTDGAGDAARLTLPAMGGYTANLPPLQAAAAGGGFFMLTPDVDGTIRRAPLVARHGDSLYGALALETVRQFLLLDEVALRTHPMGERLVVEGIELPGFTSVPSDPGGQVLIPFRGPRGSFPYVSAADVLDGKEDERLDGAVVVVGTTAPGLFDLVSTPISPTYPGVEVHATLMAALLEEDYLHEPGWAPGANTVLTAVPGVVLASALPFLPPLFQLLAASLVGALVLGLVLAAWWAYGWVLALALPLAVCLLLLGVNLAYGFLVEARAKRELARMFSQYVPPELVDEMSRDPESYGFAGESRELTILFCDIRDFTGIAERLEADGLKRLLNRFFTPMTRRIFEHRGTVDKYVGDMIMAFWGAPVPDPDHARRAVAGALALVEEQRRLNAAFREEGLPELEIGIGLNTGVAHVGDMGSEYRRAYTVLGDTVNLASRLEHTTQDYGASIVVGEATWAATREEFLYRELDLIRVKGRDQAVRIFEPVCRREAASAAQRAETAALAAALADYRQRHWGKAHEAFASLAAHHPGRRLYRVYLERIEALRADDPGSGWDGVFARPEK